MQVFLSQLEESSVCFIDSFPDSLHLVTQLVFVFGLFLSHKNYILRFTICFCARGHGVLDMLDTAW